MCGDVSHPEPGHVGPDRMGTGAVSWGALVWGESGRGLRVWGDFGSTGLGYSTDSVVRILLLKRGDLWSLSSNCVTAQPLLYALRPQDVWLTLIYNTVCERIYVRSLIEIQPQRDLFGSLFCNIYFEDRMCGHGSAERRISSGKTEKWSKFKSWIMSNIYQVDL